MNITLSATQKRFVDDRVSSGGYVDASDVVREAVRLLEARHLAGGFSRTSTLHSLQNGDGDIEALVFNTMMEAAKSAQEDLKAMVTSMTAINTAKREMRQALVTARLDSFSEMGEMESLRLQMAMERRSKIMAALSTLLKMTSDTASDIPQNLK